MKKTGNELSLVEKSIFYSGILILLVLFGYLTYQAVYSKRTHADLQVAIVKEELWPMAFKVEVKNEGGQTAEEVSVQFTLYENGENIATTSASANYIPIRSKVKMWVVFEGVHEYDSLVVTSITFREP